MIACHGHTYHSLFVTLFPGGSDALVAIWHDSTASDATEAAEAAEQLAEQEQALQNALAVRHDGHPWRS